MQEPQFRLKNKNGHIYDIINEKIFTIKCPVCQVTITLNPLTCLQEWRENQFYGIFSCPNCLHPITLFGSLQQVHINSITKYKLENLQIYPTAHYKHTFAKEICDLSPNFIEIYSQSMECKIHGYNQLVGMGFRKSIEFLITDYITNFLHETPKGKLEDRIKQLGLSEEDAIFADVVRLAGNDETHTKKATDFSIEDMIYCIDVLTQKLLVNIKSREYINRKKQAGK